MEKYIALLKGINVGGHKLIKMNDLIKLLSKLNFQNITSYIQSGNIIFNSPKTEHKILETQIGNLIAEHYKFEVPVIIRTLDEMKKLASYRPFVIDSTIDNEKLFITFLSEQPAQENILKINVKDFEPEKFELVGNNIYVFCTNGYGNTKLDNNFLSKKLKVNATTRKFSTVSEIIKKAEQNYL